MPYTPPSHRSPASSASTSPDASRRSSIVSGSRPSLPRSASYLNKHRRTPSLTDVNNATSGTSTDAAETIRNTVANLGPSVRQSPPPPHDQRDLIPKGAIMSPPESASSGSDEDEPPEIRGRKLDNLKDLRVAVSQIPQTRTPSPPPCPPVEAEPVSRKDMRVSFSTSALSDLTIAGRRASHARSATEPHAPILVIKSAENSLMASDEDTDEDIRNKPPMVRKKSGELVRPALRASHRRPSSMPGTPVFSKAVHFDSHLEHVRHFLQVDRPLAVSAGSSPVDNYESDSEYPFPGTNSDKPSVRSPPFEWELVTTNFPHHSHTRKSMPVRLEKVWLSSDQKSLLGSVAVANLAFHKHITCRFTLDYWKTVSEITGEYSHEIRPREGPIGHDRFTFTIKLSDMANLETKTLFFCVRYAVNGQEFWDNNGSTNFQVDFKKKHLPQNGKNGLQGAASRTLNGLPRSNRRPVTGSNLRPVSVPTSLDAFGNEPNKLNFDQPIHEYLGESGSTGLRLKTKSSPHLASDNIARNVTSPSGVVFSNRYDFGASLSAAMQAAKDASAKDKDNLYMKRNVRGLEASPPGTRNADSPVMSAGHSPNGTQSPNSSLPSASYEELVNKYCFFGSKQSSPSMSDGTLKGGSFDGSKGGFDTGTATKFSQHAPTAMHHSIHLTDSGSYFASLGGGVSLSTPPTSLSEPKSASFTLPMSVTMPTPPTLASGAGSPSSESSYRSAQQMLSDRFPWTTETQSATAILG
ncbi:hypothetical protein HIM_04126 [Hirsutella minnesotensis 3608]|uniref:CBM21 domain-containing protein n=1 Tax=Hirsutella minnesotensis 3608 TaxID=1043627 RepID=A0A0F8A1Q1_9HYPO|nr:hypothetical protein HIM_04126 [Hirsutella minnesotensis 3608]